MATYEDISSLLKETRIKKNADLDSASKELRVRKEHLEMLENGQFVELESQIYLKGCLRSYSNWLGLDSNEIVSDFKEAKIPASLNKLSPTKPSYAFATEDDQKPGYSKSFAFLGLAIIIYGIWLLVGNPFVKAPAYGDIDAIINEETKKQDKTSSTLEEKEEIAEIKSPLDGYDKFFIIALKKVEIKINDKVTNLNIGEVMFVEKAQLKKIVTDNPDFVEVYTDAEDSKLIGSLKTINKSIKILSQTKQEPVAKQ